MYYTNYMRINALTTVRRTDLVTHEHGDKYENRNFKVLIMEININRTITN